MAAALGIRGANPIWVLVNLWGKLFDDTYWMWVLDNDIPYLPVPVFHDPDLSVAWDNPIQFLANGTLPNDIFFEPNTTYRLEFRQHIGLGIPTQSDPLIYLVEDYMPGAGGGSPFDTIATISSNQITNPQFALYNLSAPFTFTGNAADLPIPNKIEVAPGWFLNLSGTGTVTIAQVPLNNSEANPSNAPYALHITASGWTANSLFLSQRFFQNGMLWANQYVSGAITASLGADELPQNISSQLVDSNATLLGTIIFPQAVVPSFNQLTGSTSVPLPATTNPDLPPAAYIDYQILLPSNIDIFVSSIQLLVQDTPAQPVFEQDSINRQIDNTFHYYKPQLSYKPIPSLLTAWDFPLNPAQFAGDSGTISNTTAAYIWDQTIAKSVVGSVAVARDSVTGGFQATTANADEAFYIMQYLSGAQAKKILGSKLAVNVNAFRASNVGGAVTATVYLYCSRSAGSIPTLPTSIGTIAADGTFTLTAANWSEIPRSGFGDAFGTLSAVTQVDYSNLNAAVDLNFNGWELVDPTQISDTANFAIVVTFSCPTTGSVVSIGSIGLMSGDIATRPAPQTWDQVLAECEYYYEKSYDNDYYGGDNATAGQEFGEQLINVTGGNIQLIARKFSIQYRRVKRIAPTDVNNSLIFWTPPGTISNVLGIIRNGGTSFTNAAIPISNWQIEGPGTKYASFLPNNVSALVSGSGSNNFAEAYLAFQYIADVRLGMF